jgi:hypothetical protein
MSHTHVEQSQATRTIFIRILDAMMHANHLAITPMHAIQRDFAEAYDAFDRAVSTHGSDSQEAKDAESVVDAIEARLKAATDVYDNVYAVTDAIRNVIIALMNETNLVELS